MQVIIIKWWIIKILKTFCFCNSSQEISHWGRVTYICVSKLTIICSDNGLPPDRHQAIIWTNAGILLIRTLGTNFSEILGEIHSFSFKKMHLKMSSAKERLFGLGLNEWNVHCFTPVLLYILQVKTLSIWSFLLCALSCDWSNWLSRHDNTLLTLNTIISTKWLYISIKT